MNFSAIMLAQYPNITEKRYKKLSLQVSTEGLSFCVTDTLNQRVLALGEVHFDASNKTAPIEELYGRAMHSYSELTDKYDEILLLHYNNLSTFVPTALFDEHFIGSYLQYNVKVFESDFFAYDEISAYHMNSVYVPDVRINNFFVDQYGTFDYKHAHTVLVTKLLEASKNVDEKKIFVHFNKHHFEIVVVQNQNLLLFNCFEYKTPEDFVYYLLFAAEQLNLNPESFKLELLGDISDSSEFFKLAYKYIRNVALYDTDDMHHNDFSATDNRKHFILFHS